MTIKVGERIPSVTLKHMTPDGPADITTDEVFGGRKVAVLGVPGAYTPTCSMKHLPGFVETARAFKDKGVDAIVCITVNDPFVAQKWAEDQGADGVVTMLPDGNAELTRAMGLELDGTAAGLGLRCKRFAMIVDDGVVKSLHVEDTPKSVEQTNADVLLAEL